MTEKSISAQLIRLINERPTKTWYLNKNQFPTGTNWEEVASLTKAAGYQVDDQGTIIKGWL